MRTPPANVYSSADTPRESDVQSDPGTPNLSDGGDGGNQEETGAPDGVNKLMNFDLKADTFIVKNPGLNEMYKVVERSVW